MPFDVQAKLAELDARAHELEGVQASIQGMQLQNAMLQSELDGCHALASLQVGRTPAEWHSLHRQLRRAESVSTCSPWHLTSALR